MEKYLLISICLLMGVLILINFRKLNKKINQVNQKLGIETKNVSEKMNESENVTSDQKNLVIPDKNVEEEKEVVQTIPVPTTELEGNLKENVSTEEHKVIQKVDFKLSQTRVQGLSHKKAKPPIPCQDYGKAGILSNGFHVILVSDGAGSSKLSHVASEFCVNTLYSHLQVFDFSNLIPNPEQPELLQKNWNKAVFELFERTRNALLNLSKENNVHPTDLYCTLLLVIKTDWGFLSANIGDGRSGVSAGKPFSLSVPLQTFTAGATFFLIKEGWENIFRAYTMIIPDWSKVKYFFATTDGCQDFVMDWSKKGPRQGIYDNVLGDEARYDHNVPYEAFFDGLLASLNEIDDEKERNERLRRLVENGIYLLSGEEKELKSISDPFLDDDKTLIIFHI